MLMENESCDINAKDENGRTALHLATTAGHTETANVILRESKCRINAADEDGKTILQTATLAGQVHLVKFLVNKDCDFNAEYEDGRTALHFALSMGHAGIALLLIDGNHKSKADLRAKDNRGTTALIYTAYGLSSQLEEPLSTGVSTSTEINGNVPSLSAVSQVIFDHLISEGGGTWEVDSDKETALHHAISSSNEAAALCLLDYLNESIAELVYNKPDSDLLLIRSC
ncbi:hypothetical protein ACHAPO_010600 [Fusarium lateritium]